MATEVDICNLALAHLGDAATVASISNPEGSAQASHCARFYPVARNALLEMSTWGFATTRVILAQVTNSFTEWDYAYAAPSDMINSIAVLPSDATDDYSAQYVTGYTPLGVVNTGQAVYEPQPYAIELDPVTSEQVILTDQESATLRYTKFVTDPTSFSPTFITTLSYLLASYLAGPLIKGDAGMKVSLQMKQLAHNELAFSRPSDASQGFTRVTQSTPWMTSR